MVVLEALVAEEALGEVVVEGLTGEEEGEEEEVMDGEEEVWTEMEAMAEMVEAWVEQDQEIPGQATGSVSRQPVETQTLLGGRNATNVRRRKGRIQEMQAKGEVLVEEGEEEDTVVAVDLEEAGVEDLVTEVDEVAAVDTGVASEVTEEAAAEALVVGEVEVLVGIGVEGAVVVSVTAVVGEEGSGEIGVVAP